MTNSIERLAIMLVLAAVAMPLSAGAQEPPKKPAAAAPAKPAAPAARPAAPAPHPVPAARVAPAPHPAPAARIAPPQPTPQRAAVPHVAPQRAAAPQPRVQERATRREQHIQNQQARTPARQIKQQARTPQLRQQAQTPQLKQQAQTPQATVKPRQALRDERALRRAESRSLRSLPPKERAARREDIRQAREQRVQQRQQQTQPNSLQAQPSLASTQSTRLRRNGQARVTTQQAQQGRFASRFATQAQTANANANDRHWHSGRFAAHHAWRRGLLAAFTPWYGPVFWPYAYSDVFDYTFWPGGYDDGYFAYAYDDFFDGVFFGEGGPPQEYVGSVAPVPAPAAARASYAAVQELCKQPGSGVTAWPIADIEKKVGLNDEQKQLLADVKNAGAKAADVFKASCPPENAFPMTPPGRLTAMTARLDATLEAVQTVKPALEKFYASLSDEQKERFNQIGPKTAIASAASRPAETTGSAANADSCKQQKPGLTNLPIERIEDAVKPTDVQADGLKNLEDATAKAVSIMQTACPEDTPITPPGRLEAMETRLKAMIEAANTVKPALENFYGSLSAEQKARFNRIGGALAQAD